jgi:hypothetical protein
MKQDLKVKLRDCIKGAFITCIVVVSEVLLKVHLKIRLEDGLESTAYEGFHSFKIVQKFNQSLHLQKTTSGIFHHACLYSGSLQLHRLRRGRLITGKKSFSAGNGFDGTLYIQCVQAVSNRLGRVFKS